MGNADPVLMGRYKIMPGEGEHTNAVSYRAHLEPSVHKQYSRITNQYQLALFHYVTRSQTNFVENKIKRKSGVYASSYADLQKKHRTSGLFCIASERFRVFLCTCKDWYVSRIGCPQDWYFQNQDISAVSMSCTACDTKSMSLLFFPHLEARW
jgi:hypothetical protein